MKKLLLIGLTLSLFQMLQAQSIKEVHWTYSAVKVGDKTYEVHMTAAIDGDYHLYAQEVGGDGPIPTKFTFTKTPLLSLSGGVLEKGKVIKKYESAWNHDVNYYEKTVDFVQVVKLKGNVKTDLSGKVEFMVCNDKQCLPPSEVDIKVNVGG